MNAIEKKKWKNLSIFSIIVIVIVSIVFLLLKGISVEAAKSIAKCSVILILFGSSRIFCARDTSC